MGQEMRRDFEEDLPTPRLPMEEIENRFQGEWIVMEDTEFEDMARITGGRVIFHSPDRDVAWNTAMELDLKKPAVLFMGGPPDDVDFAL